MKNMMKRLLCLLLALVMCAGLALGAAAEGEGGEEVYASKFDAIKPSALELFEGQTETVAADVQPSNYNMSINWKSDDPSVATVNGKDNMTADVTAVHDGSTTITATVIGENGEEITQSCSVEVKKNVIESITIESVNGSGTISGKGTLQLRAHAEYSDGSSPILEDASWFSSSTDIATVTSDGLVEAIGVGIAQITAKANNNDTLTATFNIEVKEPKTSVVLSGDRVNGGNGKYTLTMSTDSTANIIAEIQPDNTFMEPGEIKWSVDKSSIVSVDNGTITAKSKGTATVTVECEGADEAKLTVFVGTPNKNITASTSHGTTIKGLTGIQTKLSDAYKEFYSSEPGDDVKIIITPPSSNTYGTLYKGSTTSSKNTVTASDKLSITQIGGLYFVPNSLGSYVANYRFINGTQTLLEGTITITVTPKERDITISLSDDSTEYKFSSSSNLEKTAGTTIIKNAVKDASGQECSYIEFGSSSSNKVGTLYANSSEKKLSSYDSYTYKSSGIKDYQSSIGNLYFVPKTEGTYSIRYTAYSSNDTKLCSGSLKIEVGISNDTTVTVTLDDDGSYTFSSKTKKDKTSAASAIDGMIQKESGTYSYIKFGSIVSGSGVGTLYADSDETKLNTSTPYKRSANAANSVSDLYFVPEKSGTYVRSFTAYGSDNKKMLDGTLKIVVPGESDGEMDIYFNTTTGSTISLSENVFESWYRQQKGTNYKLAYVTFDDASRSFGSFKHSSSSFTPGNSVKYFAGGFTGSTGSSPKYLDNVKFTAPSSTGCVSVDFTCYGGTGSSAYSTKVSGTFFIFVTKNSVKGVTRDVKSGSAVTLRESEFSAVHESAMSLSSTSSARYYIELLEIPSKGTLYYNYTSAGKPGTKLTGSNFDDYEFYVNSSSSYDSVSDLTYVPANANSGTVSVRYLAKSTNGDPMYVGSISFNYGKQQGATISCSSDGYTFKTSDFYSSSDSDPVAYVTFIQPDYGELMLGYTNGRGVPLDSSVRLYTSKNTNGSYPLTSLSYIPKAGFSGNVDVYYTAVTEAGKSQSGVLTIAVTSRKGSAHFKDVSSSGSGAWASDAIDFAYKWGLVNGTGEGTFSPDSTMTRAMLVTILYRSAGSPKVSGSCPFTDVPAGAYYYDAVIWAAENGIVTGTSATTFSPNRDVNREQVATFLHRYAKYNGENVAVTGTLNGYADKSSVSQYAIEPVSWAVQHGYITSNSGTSELLLSPGGNATRAQVAVMLHRFLTY